MYSQTLLFQSPMGHKNLAVLLGFSNDIKKMADWAFVWGSMKWL